MEEEKFNQIKYQNEFIKQKYDRVNLTVPKGKKEKIKAAAKAAGQSVNEYINSAIDSYMKL
jgi:predicted HicB family RNase H-like nuclease